MIISLHGYDVAGVFMLQTSAGYETDEGPKVWLAVNQCVLKNARGDYLPSVLRAIAAQLMRDAAAMQAERRESGRRSSP